MSSDDEINSLLGGGVRILLSSRNNGKISHYVSGGALAPGRCLWIDCTAADGAATQAAAIEAAIGG
jgi:hypothetical protein